MPEWQSGEIDSLLMQRRMPYRLLLPRDYESSGKRFPVLYLLHGLFGSCENWTTLTELASIEPRHGLIIVMPEGEDGWYTDGLQATDNYESYLIAELIPAIDERFATRAERGGRAIAGNSMGGYGAFKFAMKFPEMFDFAASTSGAFDATNWSDQSMPDDWAEYRQSIEKIFGDSPGDIRKGNDLWALVGCSSQDEIREWPFLYFDCGRSDPFIETNRGLAARLGERRVNFTFRELDGGHDWNYWTERGRYFVELASKRLYQSANI